MAFQRLLSPSFLLGEWYELWAAALGKLSPCFCLKIARIHRRTRTDFESRYVASDGNCYGIDSTTDRNIGQTFNGRQDTIQVGRTGARIMPIEFLLDSKAYSYIT